MVDKPPSKVAVAPQRIRLEAATQYSLDAFSTQDGVPTKRPPFVDVSGEVGRMPVRAGGSCQLGGGLFCLVVVGRPYSLPLMPLTCSSTTTRRTGSDPAPSREVTFPHITVVASSSMGVGASLNCSIYYNFLRELPRTPYRRSSRDSILQSTWLNKG